MHTHRSGILATASIVLMLLLLPSGPVTAADPVAAVQVSASATYSCAVLANGQARCWGANDFGELGDGTRTDRPHPVAVLNRAGTGPLRHVVQIAAGGTHTCALLASGQVRCWGLNERSTLGDGTARNSLRPVMVLDSAGAGPLRNVVQIAAGTGHTCARLVGGELRCWGSDDVGQLGDGSSEVVRGLPVVVRDSDGRGALKGVVDIAVGNLHTCAVLARGEVRCWGHGNIGQLGDGGSRDHDLPRAVLDAAGRGRFRGVRLVAAGGAHTCALLFSGQLRCWGWNPHGALGDGTRTNRRFPVIVTDGLRSGRLTGAVAVSAGESHTCAVLASGGARCWGVNQSGGLGDGSRADRSRPVAVLDAQGTGRLKAVLRIDAGLRHSCAIVRGGVRCWGWNASGQLGDGTTLDRLRPVPVRW